MKVFKTIMQIGGIIGSVAVIGGAAIYADNFKEGQDKILETVDYINTEQSILSEEVASMHDSVLRLEDKIDQNAEDDNRFRRAWWFQYNNEARYTKGQLDTILTEILKKNGNLIVETLPE